ncbi:hypothetical protein GDO86_003078 [Hymenochirus boettgeri]|uniref:BHLH domain-containing protein n=1 Tax=Hymenochirus boettgeri TaxID=247094 RepID=A0A8T2K3L9_9PIPI|nr:hypothetical protein GDO86_003078 [Hymenochirus boettgeri]
MPPVISLHYGGDLLRVTKSLLHVTITLLHQFTTQQSLFVLQLRKLHRNGSSELQEQKDAPTWRVREVYSGCSRLEDICMTEEMLYDLDCYLTDTSDTLFTMTHGMVPPYQSPDYDYSGNSDMIQPDLSAFQPSPDDFVDMSDFFSGPRIHQLPLYCQEQNCFSNYNEVITPQPHPAAGLCQRAPQPHSSFGQQSDSSFARSVICPSFANTTVSCISPSMEPKQLHHYSLPCSNFNTDTDSFQHEQSLQSQCISHNVSVNNHDIVFPHVSCPKNNYSLSVTEAGILGSASPPADVYPLYTEHSSLVPPHIFPFQKQEGADPQSFHGIALSTVQPLVPTTIQCTPGFSPPAPPTIFVSPVLCQQGNNSISESTTRCSAPLLPKTERLSHSSFCVIIYYILGSLKVEIRRITHISAEQKRRCNIKIGFDTLHSLVTSLHGQHSNKLSKAATLHKTADYVYKLQQERDQLQEEAQLLRCKTQELNNSISLCQQQLPASGVPMTQQRFQHMRQMFKNYVQARTLQNWKFWLFSLIFGPLFESFNRMVSTASLADLRRTSLDWLDQHCSLPALRPTVLSSLCQLSTSTSILTDPSLMPEQAMQAVTRRDNAEIFL